MNFEPKVTVLLKYFNVCIYVFVTRDICTILSCILTAEDLLHLAVRVHVSVCDGSQAVRQGRQLLLLF